MICEERSVSYSWPFDKTRVSTWVNLTRNGGNARINCSTINCERTDY